jgi:chromate reductase, NAD(P)H dehydrogenase (quinone)
MTRVLGISGSLRAASYDTALVKLAGERLDGLALFVLADLRLPLFDQDLEVQDLPAGVEQLFH